MTKNRWQLIGSSFNHLCTGQRNDEDIDCFVSLIFLMALRHSFISTYTQIVFNVHPLSFFTPFGKNFINPHTKCTLHSGILFQDELIGVKLALNKLSCLSSTMVRSQGFCGVQMILVHWLQFWHLRYSHLFCSFV